RRGRMVGVQVLEPAPGELLAELGVRRAADPERMPGAEDVVEVAGLGQLGRADAAAELRLALEDAHAPAATRQQRGTGERVDPAADDDRVSHARARGTRRRSRARACASRAPSRARAPRRTDPRARRARAPRP